VQALVGDTSDNVPGVPGIGVKTASALIQEYGDLETLLARAGEIKQPKRRELLATYAEQARLSRRLVTLDCNVEVGTPLAALALPPLDPERVLASAKAIELGTLAKRVAQDPGVPMETVTADPRLVSARAPAWVTAGPDKMVVSVAPDAPVAEHAIPERPTLRPYFNPRDNRAPPPDGHSGPVPPAAAAASS